MTPYITPMRGRRVRLNAAGREISPTHAGLEGVIWGEARTRHSWKIRFPGRRTLIGLHKSFVEILEDQMDFPKLNDIKVGDRLKADGGFTCLTDGQVVEVKQDDQGKFVECSVGHHYLDGQEGTDGECVGLWRFDQPHR